MKSILYLLVSGLLSSFLFGQGELYQVSHGPVSMVIPFQPLSEKGENYFAREQQALQAAQQGFSIGNASSSSSPGQHNANEISLYQGHIAAHTALGGCAVTGSTDIVSIFNFASAVFKAVCRYVDINGHYYRDDKAEFLENILYQVDKDRYALYKNGYGSNVQGTYAAEIECLQTKIYELEIEIATCTGKKNARRDAAKAACERLKALLRGLELQCTYSYEQKHLVIHHRAQ